MVESGHTKVLKMIRFRQHQVDRTLVGATHEVIKLDRGFEEVSFDDTEQRISVGVNFLLEGIDGILSERNEMLQKSSNPHSVKGDQHGIGSVGNVDWWAIAELDQDPMEGRSIDCNVNRNIATWSYHLDDRNDSVLRLLI